MSFGNLYISNPTLVDKIKNGVTEFTPVNKAYMYAGEEKGFTDYI